MLAKAQSANMKKWLRQLQEGTVTKGAIVSKLQKYIADMSTKNSAADVEEHLAKYYDALMFIPILKGSAAPSSANVQAQVNAAKNSFTRRVREKKAARSASRGPSAARGRSASRGPRPQAEKNANKERKTARAMNRRAALNVVSAKYGRKPERAATIAELLAYVKAGDPPEYMKEFADKLESQLLRYSKTEKLRAKLDIKKKINELGSDIDEREAAGLISRKVATETRDKLEKLSMLLQAVSEETNVELSPESMARVEPPKPTLQRTYHVGSPMTCATLHHPCNPKIQVTSEQLMRAAQQIMETGHALREEGFPGTTKEAASAAAAPAPASTTASSRGRSRAPRSDGAAAGAGGK